MVNCQRCAIGEGGGDLPKSSAKIVDLGRELLADEIVLDFFFFLSDISFSKRTKRVQAICDTFGRLKSIVDSRKSTLFESFFHDALELVDAMKI